MNILRLLTIGLCFTFLTSHRALASSEKPEASVVFQELDAIDFNDAQRLAREAGLLVKAVKRRGMEWQNSGSFQSKTGASFVFESKSDGSEGYVLHANEIKSDSCSEVLRLTALQHTFNFQGALQVETDEGIAAIPISENQINDLCSENIAFIKWHITDCSGRLNDEIRQSCIAMVPLQRPESLRRGR